MEQVGGFDVVGFDVLDVVVVPPGHAAEMILVSAPPPPEHTFTNAALK